MINQVLGLFLQGIKSVLVTSGVLSLSLGIKTTALAADPNPPQPKPEAPTTSTGTRGGSCENTSGLPLTVLAPQKRIGLTTSAHPTFAWFVPDSKPYSIEFRIFEYGSDNQLKSLLKFYLKSSQGIMKFSLPSDNSSSLTVGKRYLWQVTIICNLNYPSRDILANAKIKVVEVPPDLKNLLSATSDHLDRANLYAKSDFWYDALSEALVSAESSKLGKVAVTLLENLAQSEEPQQSQNLWQILNLSTASYQSK